MLKILIKNALNGLFQHINVTLMEKEIQKEFHIIIRMNSNVYLTMKALNIQ
jgi:hypothetical protein